MDVGGEGGRVAGIGLGAHWQLGSWQQIICHSLVLFPKHTYMCVCYVFVCLPHTRIHIHTRTHPLSLSLSLPLSPVNLVSFSFSRPSRVDSLDFRHIHELIEDTFFCHRSESHKEGARAHALARSHQGTRVNNSYMIYYHRTKIVQLCKFVLAHRHTYVRAHSARTHTRTQSANKDKCACRRRGKPKVGGALTVQVML